LAEGDGSSANLGECDFSPPNLGQLGKDIIDWRKENQRKKNLK
jgi:hypothetical protein